MVDSALLALLANALKEARFVSSEASLDYEYAHDAGVDAAALAIAQALAKSNPSFTRQQFVDFLHTAGY